MKNFVEDHGQILYENGTGSAIASGDVIPLTNRIAIANVDIAIAGTGCAWTEGQFKLAKATGAISQDAKVYWDVSEEEITTTAEGNVLAGLASESAESADTEIIVDINKAAPDVEESE